MTCTETPVTEQSLAIRFPGGAVVSSIVPTAGGPTQLEIAKQLLAQASPGMAALQPVFTIIDALLAVKAFAEGVASNPFGVADAVTELVAKVDKLAGIVPQLSVPAMIADILTAVVTTLDGVVEVLDLLAAKEAQIATARELAAIAGNEGLLSVADCAEQQVAAELQNLLNGLAPLATLFGLVTLLMQLAGLGAPPAFAVSGGSISEVRDAINALLVPLNAVRNALPV